MFEYRVGQMGHSVATDATSPQSCAVQALSRRDEPVTRHNAPVGRGPTVGLLAIFCQPRLFGFTKSLWAASQLQIKIISPYK